MVRLIRYVDPQPYRLFTVNIPDCVVVQTWQCGYVARKISEWRPTDIDQKAFLFQHSNGQWFWALEENI
jgi:hypothetical protein